MPSTATTQNASSPIHSKYNEDPQAKNPENTQNLEKNSKNSENIEGISKNNGKNSRNYVVVRRERPSRACTQRAAQRLQQAAAAEAALAAKEKKRKVVKRKKRLARLLKEEYVGGGEEEEEEEVDDEHSRPGNKEENGGPSLSPLRQQCNSKVITPLVAEPETSQLPRWNIRSMWQLASILNFFNVFRPLLNIKVEFSAEEFETALISPNNTLGEIHMPLLKAIPPVTRVALGHNSWITVLSRKLKAWWHWVAEGEIPIVASQGAEIEAYNALDPGVRVVILKALCDIRVEQEDIRNYIDDSIKHGVHLSTFRKDCIGGDSHGVSYWYEDDSVIGHRLYREIRKVEVKRGKGKNVPPIPNSAYQWETVGTNFEELKDVSEKLFSSKNRIEASLGKKLKNDMLPEVEKVHKRKEKLLKKQHREALLLESMIHLDGLPGGRSLRDRKPVTYTFDDYDRSINEAINETKKKQISPDPNVGRDFVDHEAVTNGGCNGPSQFSRRPSFRRHSSESPDDDESGDDHKFDTLDHGNRRRQRPQRYYVKDFVEGVSDNDGDTDSDDDVVGEIVYDDEYLRHKRRKTSSSSEGDGEYEWNDENPEDEDEDEDDEDEDEEEYDDSLNSSEESDQSRKFKNLRGRSRRETKQGPVGERPSGIRRSERATKNRINYQQYEWSGSENESSKHEKSNESHEYSEASENADFSMESQDSDGNHENMDMKVDQTVEEHPEMLKKEQEHPPEISDSPGQIEVEGVKQRRFLDLNELAPCSGFDDGPNSMKDEDTDNF